VPEVVLETSRLRLRRLRPADASDLFRTVGDPAVMRYWAPGPDRSIEDTRRRIAQIDTHWRSRGFGDWGVIEKASSHLIGFAGLHYIQDMPEVNVGYAFERTMWGLGFASETCGAVLAFGFQKVGLPEIVAVIAPANHASIRVAERCGLRLWKRFRWIGRGRLAYRIRREDYQSPPPATDEPHSNGGGGRSGSGPPSRPSRVIGAHRP
jgi:ribosomal-protein-alanine N-acetyltransferase